MPRRKIRVVLADDHNVLREGLRALLELERDIEVVASVADGRAAVRAALRLAPDVVVLDIGMPDLNGIDAARRICGGKGHVRVLCLSVHRERSLVRGMLLAGASGYVLKTSAAAELIDAVRTVAKGETYLTPPVAADIVEHDVRNNHAARGPANGSVVLTPREREVLQLTAEGYNSKTIAGRMRLSVKTVLAHRHRIMRKLDLDSTAALTRYALREGVTEL